MTQSINDPKAAGEWLKSQEDLDKASFAFDQKYGEGSAKSILSGTYLPPAPEPQPVAQAATQEVAEQQPEEDDGSGWLADTAMALVEGPVSAIREGLQSLNSLGNQNLDPSDPAHYGLVRTEAQQAIKGPIEEEREAGMAARDATLNNITVFGSERDTIAGSLTQGISQALTGMLLTGGKSAVTTVAGGITSSFAAGAVYFDPDEANFVRTLDEQFDISSELTTELLSNDSESEAVNRFQNALTDGALGIAGEGVVAASILGFKALRHMRKGKIELETTGAISPETTKEIELAQLEIQKFSDLQSKPKGSMIEGRFITEDGLAFDTKSGARDVEFERARIQEAQRVPTPDALESPDIDAAPKAVDMAAPKPEVTTEAPIAPAASKNVGTPEEPRFSIFDEDLRPQGRDSPTAPKADEAPKSVANVELPKVDVVAPKAPETPSLNLRAGELRPASIDPVNVPKAPDAPKAPSAGKSFKSPLRPLQVKALSKVLDDLEATPENIDKIDAELSERLIIPSQFFENGVQVEAVLKATSLSLQKSGVIKKLTEKQSQAGVLQNATTRLSDELGVDPDAFIGKLQELAGGIDEANTMAQSARIYMNQTARLMKETIAEVEAARKAGGDSGEATIRYLNLVDRHAAIQEAVQGIRTGVGRGLGLQKAMITEDITDMSISFLDSMGGAGKAGERAIDLANKLKSAKTDKARAALIRKARTEHSKVWGMANELFMGGILSGVPTQVLNIAATTVNVVSRPYLRYTGAMVKGGKPVRQQAALEFAYAFTTLADSMRLLHLQGGKIALKNDFTDNPLAMALKAGKTDNPVLDAQTKFGDADVSGRNAISADSWVAPARWIVNGIGHTINVSRRGLGTTDELFKQVIFRSQIKARAMMDAREMGDEALLAQGFKNKSAYVQHHLKNSVHNFENLSERYRELVKTGRAVDDDDLRDEFIKESLGSANSTGKYTRDALTEARAATFTTPLEPDAFMKKAEQWANSQPALKQVAPFIRTPTNVLRENFERLPVVNLFMTHLKRDLKSSDPSVRALARGKFIYGYTSAVLAMGMAYNGKMTGSGPNWSDEPAEAKLWAENPNWQPNSWIFDQPDGSKKFIDVSKLLPHLGAFTVVAQITEDFQRYEEEFSASELNEQAGIIMGSAIALFASQVTMQSAFSGAGEAMEILNGDGGWQAAQAWIENRSVAMLPHSSFNYNANKEMDGMVRDTTDYMEKLKSRLPSAGMMMYGATRDAPFKHNFLTGKPLSTPDMTLHFLKTSQSNSDPIENEVFEELMKIDGGLRGPSKRIGQRKISPAIHQRLNQLTGSVTIGGDTLMTSLHKMINEPEYDREAQRIDYNVTPFRRNLLQSVIQSYKDEALAELVSQYPELENEINKLMEVDAMLKAGVMPDEAGFANRNGRLELPQ